MSAGAAVGYGINIAAYGVIMIPCLALWYYFTNVFNTLNDMGLMDQNGMNAFYMLTIMLNALAFLFLLTNVYGLIVVAKSDASKEV